MRRFHLPKFSTQIVKTKISDYLPNSFNKTSNESSDQQDQFSVNQFRAPESVKFRTQFCTNCCTPISKIGFKNSPPKIHGSHGDAEGQNSLLKFNSKWNPHPTKTVTVGEALCTIFGPQFQHMQKTLDGDGSDADEDFPLCTNCANSLTQLFESYHQFNHLRHPRSVMNSKFEITPQKLQNVTNSPRNLDQDNSTATVDLPKIQKYDSPPPPPPPPQPQSPIPELIKMAESRTRMEALVQFLLNNHLTLSSCESLTGGLFAERLTDVPGSSQVFAGGFVTYTNNAKNKVAKVPTEIIERFGAVSPETAVCMAKNTQMTLSTDVVISFTGNAGPWPSENKPIGLVYIAVGFGGSIVVTECHFEGCRSRLEVKTFCVDEGIKNIFKIVEKTF